MLLLLLPNLPVGSFEPTLSGSMNYLRERIARKAMYSRTPADWDADQTADIQECLDDALREFYHPKKFPGQVIAHSWSFMRPTASITTSEVDDVRPIVYDLPDDFAYMLGPITFAAGVMYSPIDMRNEAQIRDAYAGCDQTGIPTQAAVRPKASTGQSGQRHELMLFPRPDRDYVLTFRYSRLPNALTSDRPYPLGGEAHFGTILEMCLAKVEQNLFDEHDGPHTRNADVRLLASISEDIRAGAAESLGPMTDPGRIVRDGRGRPDVTFNGVLYG